jgi:hypothetical protein
LVSLELLSWRKYGKAKERPRPNEKLVRVFDSEQGTEAMVARGLLESADIDCDVTSLVHNRKSFPVWEVPSFWCVRKMRLRRGG